MKQIKVFLGTFLAMVASIVMVQPLSAQQIATRSDSEGTVLYELDDNYDKKSLIDYGNVVYYCDFMKMFGQLYGYELTAEFDGDQPGSKITKVVRKSIYGNTSESETETQYWKNYTKEKFIAFCKEELGIKDGEEEEGFQEPEDMVYLTRMDETDNSIVLTFSGTSKSTGIWVKGTVTAEFDNNGKCIKCHEKATSNMEGYEQFDEDLTDGYEGLSKFLIRYYFSEMFDSEGELPNAVELVANTTSVKGIYNLDGKRVAAPMKGVNIISYSNGTVRKVVVR